MPANTGYVIFGQCTPESVELVKKIARQDDCTDSNAFGGGTYGFRGFGRDHLSPFACVAGMSGCSRALVGGRSLVESSVELRYLPFRKQFGERDERVSDGD